MGAGMHLIQKHWKKGFVGEEIVWPANAVSLSTFAAVKIR